LVVHLEHSGGPRLVFLNKTCRLCPICETLIVDQVELERVIIAAGVTAIIQSRSDGPHNMALHPTPPASLARRSRRG
jgi:hypothetical protein